MIYTVTFNPSLDYVVKVPELNVGKVNRSSSEVIIPGGKGINVSMVLTNLGIDTRAVAFTAGFTGETFKKLVKDKNLNADFIDIDEGTTRINVKIRSGEVTEVNGQGPMVSAEHIGRLYEKLDYLDSDDYLVLAGSIPDSMPRSVYMDIMQRLQFNDIKIVVDATGELLINVLPYKPFLVKPNKDELAAIFEVDINTKEDVIKYGKIIQEKGAKNVLVSMAGDGAILIAEDGNVYQSEAPKGEVKNEVGAGDSMVAGFLAGYIETGDFEKSLRIGICAGSASAFSEELAKREELVELYRGMY